MSAVKSGSSRKPVAKPSVAAGKPETEAAKLRRAREMIDSLLEESKQLSIRAGQTLARLS